MGVQKEILKTGNGTKPVRGQNVTVHCTGFDGELYKARVGLGSGWDEGVLGMEVGEIARLQCSPDYAYGANGFPAWGIQPNSVLVFEIEVLGAQ
ncbi:hypothetical protein KFK09_024953 [Dendrobium nobile]|uniref:peptidylprolyl isomerase n=1 Tax=Dendrobium nobile TaxID=94219 RepID=A0A8T3AF71_DENNO|nr:hypothetical protein KFK09_024953 [Dendrobium nobile]